MIKIAVKKARKGHKSSLECAFAQFEAVQRQITALNHQISVLRAEQAEAKAFIEQACSENGGDIILGPYRAKEIHVGERIVRPYSYVKITV